MCNNLKLDRNTENDHEQVLLYKKTANDQVDGFIETETVKGG